MTRDGSRSGRQLRFRSFACGALEVVDGVGTVALDREGAADGWQGNGGCVVGLGLELGEAWLRSLLVGAEEAEDAHSGDVWERELTRSVSEAEECSWRVDVGVTTKYNSRGGERSLNQNLLDETR